MYIEKILLRNANTEAMKCTKLPNAIAIACKRVTTETRQ